MSQITDDLFKKIAPTLPASARAEYIKWLNVYCFKYDINDELRLGAFSGNTMEESGRFTRTEENLNYSAPRLMKVWPRRFPTLALASQYAHQPIKLANYVYGGRLGNRPNTNDGWDYRGGGSDQTTGRDGYRRVGNELGLDLVAHPELLRTIRYAIQSACFEFQDRGCNEMADSRRFTKTVEAINGR